MPADAESANAKLLAQAGFVDFPAAGVVSWLPLGLRVLRKVEAIVREEMNVLGGQELLLPALHPKELWDQTGRWKMDVLFKLKSQTGSEYALGPTHEEIITPLAARAIQSYKDLPVYLYQIQTKFRDELRAKSGVLRGREFGMKDLYSFHVSEEDLLAFYPKVIEAYKKIFARCGVEVRVTEASGGSFTKKYSHEFQILTPAGEDDLVICDSCAFAQNKEIATVKVGAKCPSCKSGKVKEAKGIEAGNIFDLGTKFSEAFGLEFTDEHGKRHPVVMGCYGFGTTRMVGAIVEASHDDRGIVWPKSVAPYGVHVVLLEPRNHLPAGQAGNPPARRSGGEPRRAAEKLVGELESAGVEVLYDDRESASAGEKFADADLIGIPLRLVVSEKTMAAGAVEWKERTAKTAEMVKQSEVVNKVRLLMS